MRALEQADEERGPTVEHGIDERDDGKGRELTQKISTTAGRGETKYVTRTDSEYDKLTNVPIAKVPRKPDEHWYEGPNQCRYDDPSTHYLPPNDRVERPATAAIPHRRARNPLRARCGHDVSRSAPTCC